MSGVQQIMNGKSLKKLSAGAWVGIGLNTYFAVSEYKDSRAQGNSVVSSAAKSIGEGIMAEVIGPGAYLGLAALETIPKVGMQAVGSINQASRSMTSLSRNTPFINANFNDSQQAFTMRQAGMQMAKASKYNLQQTLMGNEAQYMHL